MTKEKICIIIKSYQREKQKITIYKRRWKYGRYYGKVKTIITDEEGNKIDLENIDQYIGQTLILKIVQVDKGKVIKEIKINK